MKSHIYQPPVAGIPTRIISAKEKPKGLKHLALAAALCGGPYSIGGIKKQPLALPRKEASNNG